MVDAGHIFKSSSYSLTEFITSSLSHLFLEYILKDLRLWNITQKRFELHISEQV
jgi:hypothetical protein